MLRRSVGFNSLLLGAFALVTAGVVATTQQLTKDSIAQSRTRAAQQALYEIIPQERHDNDLLADTLQIPEEYQEVLGLSDRAANKKQIHVARRAGEPFAVIVPTVAPDGYSGAIEMIMGIDRSGILGLRVTRHNETPGLGDKIETRKSNWILSFDGKSASARLDGRDPGFDQLTGATITRKAVTRQVQRTLRFFDEAGLLEDLSPVKVGEGEAVPLDRLSGTEANSGRGYSGNRNER
ncbi:RnfABCDGE type electron transport complex subunit G [Gilvimarinus sp. F26214L]